MSEDVIGYRVTSDARLDEARKLLARLGTRLHCADEGCVDRKITVGVIAAAIDDAFEAGKNISTVDALAQANEQGYRCGFRAGAESERSDIQALLRLRKVPA